MQVNSTLNSGSVLFNDVEPGFRELTGEEIDAVAGGAGFYQVGDFNVGWGNNGWVASYNGAWAMTYVDGVFNLEIY